jgi:ubiquinone/menaquinone biosynthesis C-methylase UbiE
MTTFKEFEHHGWQEVASRYHAAFSAVTTQSVEPLLDAVGADRGTRLLDLACGPGYATAGAAARGATVLGIDFSSEMIAEARKRYPGIPFEEGDAEDLSFGDGEFDAVVMNYGMLHLSHPELAVAESHRVLRPGGRFAFTVWDVPEKTRGLGIVLEAIQKHGDLNVPIPAGPPFFRFSDEAESRRLLSEAGFINAFMTRVPQLWQLASADDLFDIFYHGSVRNAALLRAQTASALSAIRSEIRAGVERFRRGNLFELPTPAVLSVAVKP